MVKKEKKQITFNLFYDDSNVDLQSLIDEYLITLYKRNSEANGWYYE